MIGVVLTGAAGVLALAAGTGLAYRRLRQRRVAAGLAIDTPSGIAEGRFVRIGGVDQWIQIRGTDRANPVLVYLAGSGFPMEPYTATLIPWERHFTVVFWDRRDVGRTRGRNGKEGHEDWTVDLFATDGIELVEFLRSHLEQDKVILVGHSQGSIVATRMARRRPDLFHAYVGTGQLADMARNEQQTHDMALDRARRAGKGGAGRRRAVAALERNTPPFRDVRSWIAKQRWSTATDAEVSSWQRKALAAVLTWPSYSLADIYRAALGVLFLPPRLFEDTMACTPELLGTHFDVPVIFLQGDSDIHALPSLAEEYLAAITAPAKVFVRLPGAGHLAPLTRTERFLAELLTHVRPFATL
jgi:pimeloyl-ACP methyl ester carboxylesterase